MTASIAVTSNCKSCHGKQVRKISPSRPFTFASEAVYAICVGFSALVGPMVITVTIPTSTISGMPEHRRDAQPASAKKENPPASPCPKAIPPRNATAG